MKNYSDGFTLLELMITLVVSAVLAAIAVPSFDSLLKSNARTASLGSINGDIRFSRSEAVAKAKTVVMCSSADGFTCSDSEVWDTGWIIFNDVNSNGSPDYGTGTCDIAEDCLYKSQGALSGGVTLRGAVSMTAGVVTDDGSKVIFGELGELSSGTSGLSLCGADADALNDTDKSRTINISASGSIFVTMGTTTCP